MQEIISELPKIKVEDKVEEIIVNVYVSGIDMSDIELEVKEDFLKININRSSKIEDKNKNWFMSEWVSLSFDGKILLPAKVIPMLPYRSYDGKILRIRLKKA